MANESILEREITLNSVNLENLNLITFKIIDGIKEILEEDRAQKQPLFMSIDEKFLIRIVKQFINERQKQCLIGVTGESASGKTTFVNFVSKAELVT